MKKFLAILMTMVMVMACGAALAESAEVKSEGVMTYAEYAAAELNSDVVIEAYVQGKQSWWQDAATIYAQDKDGAYLLYKVACTEEEYAKLVPGVKIKASGAKVEWSGEVELEEGSSIEIIEGDTYIAEAMDATALLGTEELINYQNMFAAFKGMTVEASTDAEGNEVAFLYAWDGSGAEGSDADLYFNASVNGQTYTFVIEYYVCDANGVYGAETDAYKAVQALNVGDVIDIEGFLYWYNGAQPHVTSVTAAVAE